MANREGEKWGWLGGWFGAFLWLALLSVVWLVQGKTVFGALGLALFFLAVAVVVALAPWRHPRTPYWKLMLLPYALFFGAVALCVALYGGMVAAGLEWGVFVWLLPCLLPFATMGRRSWAGDGVEQGP